LRESVLRQKHKLVDQSSVYMFSRDSVVQLYPRTLGIHFSRLLRHAWTTLGLFLLSRPAMLITPSDKLSLTKV